MLELGHLAANTPGCISLGQGTPYYQPDSAIFEKFQKLLQQNTMNEYAPDPGISQLRSKLVDKLRIDNSIKATPDEITVTNGANQAFVNILLTLADPGDKIGLISPYYFNHYMACQIGNINVEQIPLNDDYRISHERVEAAINKGIKALVLINPGNPTGMVHSRDELHLIADLIENTNVTLIADETYEYFTYQGSKHIPAASLSRLKDQTVSIGSFSKTYGIPGWRLGYYHAKLEVVDQAMKIQDTTTICAPSPAQFLGLILLEERERLVPEFTSLMENNHNVAKDLITEIPWLNPEPASGSYYLFPRQITGLNTDQLTKKLISEYGVALVAGLGFGQDFEDHLRISFANVQEEILKEAFSRLKKLNA